MTGTRHCPSCGEPIPTNDPRRVWCSGKCRRWVSKVGGPAKAAQLKRGWARVFRSVGQERDATEIESHADALDALDNETEGRSDLR